MLVVYVLTGAVAELLNGSLGMGFGTTANTVLLSYSVAPAMASATIQVAKVGAGTASSLSHWRFGNVHWPTVAGLGIPGGIGAFFGATALSSWEGDWIVPVVAVMLMGLATVVLVKALRGRGVSDADDGRPAGLGAEVAPPGRKLLMPLGAVGGFLNSIGGGGWGPVTTPMLLVSKRLAPRHVVGSVSVAEVLVALGGMAGFVVGLADRGLPVASTLALIAGGVVTAPVAAALVAKLEPARLTVAVGCMLLALNGRTLLAAAGLADGVAWLVALIAGTVLWIVLPSPSRSSSPSRGAKQVDLPA